MYPQAFDSENQGHKKEGLDCGTHKFTQILFMPLCGIKLIGKYV